MLSVLGFCLQDSKVKLAKCEKQKRKLEPESVASDAADRALQQPAKVVAFGYGSSKFNEMVMADKSCWDRINAPGIIMIARDHAKKIARHSTYRVVAWEHFECKEYAFTTHWSGNDGSNRFKANMF